jgi:hypothetical protein
MFKMVKTLCLKWSKLYIQKCQNFIEKMIQKITLNAFNMYA